MEKDVIQNKEKRYKIEYDREYRLNNKEKLDAHQEVHKQIKKGVLIRQPCGECGIEKAHAHHFDYSKPLQVEWLCASHHKLAHA